VITVHKRYRIRNHTLFGFYVLLALTGTLLAAAVFAPLLAPYDPYAQDLSIALKAPDGLHWLGTDRYGRDMLSRVLMGARSTLFTSLSLVAVVSLTGTLVGVICGWKGGKTDTLLMRISDVFLAFPGMVFAIAVAGVLGGGIMNAVLALACISWPKYARIARGQVLSIKSMPYLSAACLSGSGTAKIVFRHIMPNIAGIILVTAALDIGTTIMELAGLSFLGLGAMPPTAEWGAMMSNGRSMLQTSPRVILAPGCASFISVLIFNLLGDAVRDVLDPKINHSIGEKK